MSESLTSQDFDRRKTAYFSDFAKSHLSAFRPHYKQGEILGKGSEAWRNVSQHCLVAGVFADILADELHLSADDKDKVVKAAIMHDWFKKHESMTLRAASKEGTLSLETLFEIKAKDNQALQEMGVAQDIIKLTGANIPETLGGPQSLSEKIIWYVDAMLSNTEPVPIKQRFDDLERGWDGAKEDPSRAERNNTFNNLYKKQYHGKSLYDIQRERGDRIGAELAQMIGYQGEVNELPRKNLRGIPNGKVLLSASSSQQADEVFARKNKLPLILKDKLRERIMNYRLYL